MRYAMRYLFSSLLISPLTGELLQAKRFKSFRTRTASTVVLICGFFFLVWAGHVPLMLLVLALQVSRASCYPCTDSQIHAFSLPPNLIPHACSLASAMHACSPCPPYAPMHCRR